MYQFLIIAYLFTLNPSKALGSDELYPRVLKELSTELGPVFAHLFRQSIDTGEITKECLASYSNTLYVQISWLILMNINSCQIGNMHSGKDIVVELS